MNSVLTIRVTSVVITLGVLVAVLVAYLLGAAGRAVPSVVAAPAAVEEPGETRSIAMSGAGDATAVPDQLSFRLSVNTEASDVSAALGRGNVTMRRVQVALRDEGVRRRDVQTAGLDIHPVYDYSDDGPAVITGYAVSQDVGVLVRSLQDSGSAIAAAVEAGGNAVRLHGLHLKIGDVEALMRKARDGAVAEARAKAVQYAEATGQQLGDVVTIREVSARQPRPIPIYATDAVFGRASFQKVPIRAGSSELKVTVRVVWSFA